MATETKKQRKQFAFTGEWVSEVDPLLIGDQNFSKLENCRYSDVGVEGVLGYTKITNSVIQTTFYKGRSGIQLLSPYSGQNRVLVQAENAGLTSSSVFENVGVVPAASNFTGAPIHSDISTAGLGRFSKWPGGHIAYCNQKESRIWAGDEMRCAGFVNYSPSGDFKYDYTEAIQNLDDDVYNVATIHRVTESIDANTMALYHLADVADATANAHNLTNPGGNVTFIAAGAKFGATGASFNGTNAQLNVALPDAHFAQSGRTFTVDAWVKLTSLPTGGAVSPIYFQSTSTSVYEGLWVESDGSLKFSSRTGAGSIEQMAGASGFSTPASTIVVNTWHHVEMVQSANNFYMFVDGILKAYTTGTTTFGDQTGDLYIGYCDTLKHPTKYLFGYVDEWRFSNVARHTGAFEVASAAYGSSTYASYLYVGALRPLSGVKFYVKTANASAGVMTIDYWDGSSWAAVSGLTDGTASTGATPFEQTGTAAFTSTVSTAKVKIIDTLCLYWYRVKVTECDATTTIYHASVKSPFQSIKDLWDGVYRTAVKFMTYDDSVYKDMTTNVAEEDYDTTNDATYADLGTLSYASDYMVIGFEEPVTALQFTLVPGHVNALNCILAVYYWNGDDWASVGKIEDGTISNNTTFGKTGIISWNPVNFNTEFKTTVGDSDVPLYYYKIRTTDNAMTASIYVDKVSGITSPRNMDYGYAFPFTFASRPMLCGKVSSKEGNRVDYGGANTTEIWNGEDTSFGFAGPLYFGSSTDLTCACEIYNRFGAAIYDLAVFCKQNETYILNGTDSESWKIYQISSEIGCPAPMTMDTAEVAFGIAADATRNIALWLSASGPMVFDGSVLVPVKTRIGNYFDDEEDECINWEAVANAVGWCDPNYHEYNLCIPSGAGQTTNNVWLVLDLLKKRWFRKVPGTAGCPQGVVKVQDTYGTKYVYGLFDDGYMRRLDYGTTWDGDRVNQVIQTSDMLPSGSSWDVTEITEIRMMFEKISALTGVSVFYGQNGTSTFEKLMEFDPTNSDMRTYRDVEKVGRKCQAWSHAFEFQAGTTAVEKGLKFLGWSLEFEVLRDDNGQTLVKGNWK